MSFDEALEQRETELGGERNRVGGEAATLGRRAAGVLARALPWVAAGFRRRAARRSLETIEVLGRLSEVREVRRAMLGLGPNAHIRSRATPNFVKDNPDYRRTVEGEEAHP